MELWRVKADIIHSDHGVVKQWRDTREGRIAWATEVARYHQLPWATPPLVAWGDLYIVTEKCTPILDVPIEQSYRYEGELWDLLHRVNRAGVWHRDACLVNVVLYDNKVRLIDWQASIPAQTSVPYDIYGARAAGQEGYLIDPPPDGVHWYRPACGTCPAVYWGERGVDA